MFSGESNRLWWIDGASVHEELLTNGSGDFEVAGMAFSADRGPVLAINKVGILDRPGLREFGAGSPTDWVEHPFLPGGFLDPRALSVASDRVFGIAKKASVQQFVDRLGQCEPVVSPAEPSASPRHVVTLSDGSFVILDGGRSSPENGKLIRAEPIRHSVCE